jgi:hypothetical protein
MKTKTYRYGNVTCKAELKTAGKGWECVLYFNHKVIFVGNFIHSAEAHQWWTSMNREIATFSKKYTVGYHLPTSWVATSLKNSLYKSYYVFLEKIFVGYHRSYQKALATNIRQFKSTKKNYHVGGKKVAVLKVA